MFKDNHHTVRYYKIIDNAVSQNRRKGGEVYYESHHIIPRCLGGSNRKDNLVLLTAREHFICHCLLVKMSDEPKLLLAVQYMASTCSYKNYSSKLYAFYREQAGVASSNMMTELWSDPIVRAAKISKMKGRIVSDETKNKISKAQKGKVSARIGYSHSEETKLKISRANKGKPGNVGRMVTNETRTKMSAAQKKRIWSPDQLETRKLRHKEVMVGRKNPALANQNSSLEMREKFSKAKIGKPGNNRQKWTVTCPDGMEITTDDRKLFCEEHGLDFEKVKWKSQRNRDHDGYFFVKIPKELN